MASCQTCNTTILWGGVKKDGRRYCNSGCMEKDNFGRVADRISNSDVKEESNKIMRGPCPECNQINHDVDLRFSHRAVSYVVSTRWSKNPILSCSNCHRKKVLGDTAITFLFGWWGFPFGLIVTPMQIFLNIAAALSSNSSKTEPSSELCSFVRENLAQKLIENLNQGVAPGNELIDAKNKATLKKNLPPPIPKRMNKPQANPNVPSRSG